jgi:sec-independent protein translocase protein TatA
MRFGFGEVLVVLVIALLIFGPSKIPQLGDALGKGIRSFKRATSEADDSIDVSPTSAERAKLTAGASTAAPKTGVEAAEASAKS